MIAVFLYICRVTMLQCYNVTLVKEKRIHDGLPR